MACLSEMRLPARKAQIDHIIAGARWIISVLDFQVH